MDASAANAVAGLERAPLPDRQRRLAIAIAKRQRALRGPLKEIEPNPIAQLIRGVTDVEGGGRIAPRTTFNCNDIEPLVGQFLRENRASPAEANDHHVFRG
jgi:hypothetical protein